MKIKLLLAPSMVVIVIVLLIWVIYPAYTDPVLKDGVKEKRQEYNELKARLDNIKEKSSNIQTLANDLNSSSRSADRETVMDFLPQSIKEYEIIDNLNYLILKEELVGLAISVSQPAKVPTDIADTKPAGGSAAVPTEVKAEPKYFKVEFTVQGSYEKIKDIFLRVYGLKMFNKVTSLRIEPVNKEAGLGTDSLKASAVLEFAFMEETGSFISPEDSVFSKTTFDGQIIKDINNKKNTPLLPDLTIDEKGKANPFLP